MRVHHNHGMSSIARPTARFMLSHPAHAIALGFGSGLSPVAPGTSGTLWAWLAFLVLQFYGMTDAQVIAFGLFRFFDAVKPGPVGWADRLFHGVDRYSDPHAWTKAGFGILFDDLVAAACTVLVIALWRSIW